MTECTCGVIPDLLCQAHGQPILCPECGKDPRWCGCGKVEDPRDVRIAELEVERDRLRSALEDIADGDAESWPDCSARKRARLALEGKEKG